MNKHLILNILVVIIMSVPFSLKAQDNSVLSTGTWHKMQLSSTGIYKLSYSDLSSMGINPATLNPKNIRIFHNGGGLVPQINGDERVNDLCEIPIFVSGEDDGHFDSNDYVLFYARGPVTWKYNQQKNVYQHVKNPYSDYSYAFITTDNGEGKRISTTNSNPSPNNHETDFLDRQVIDNDVYNPNNMGAVWYFDQFDVTLSRNYSFNFPNVKTTENAYIKVAGASKNSSGSASFQIDAEGSRVATITFSASSSPHTTGETNFVKFNPTKNDVNIKVTYSRSSASSVGWLNYISVNAWCGLAFRNGQMAFRNPRWNDPMHEYTVEMGGSNNNVQIWNVSNPLNPHKINVNHSSNKAVFSTTGNINNEFVAFDGSSFLSINKAEYVENQNIHSLKGTDFLIISHPDFLTQAEELIDLHHEIDWLNINIVTPELIYNEFSCGATDISGIRDFIKHLYDNDGQRLKYVLLFGDASYDFRNKSGKVCFVPTYESNKTGSLSAVVTDDFFVCLDDGEGDVEDGWSSTPDIAIGRFPVSTDEQAENIVNKIRRYVEKSETTMNAWRNRFTFITDDDMPMFINDSEGVVDLIEKQDSHVVMNKIYLDAYNQQATSSGQRAPEVNEAIVKSIEKGSLIVNYIGHGGEVGWCEERIFTNDNILSLRNSPMLPFFVTACCEFSRYDDHTRTSAGEYTFLNEYGGAIALLTTARQTTEPPNCQLLIRLYNKMFQIKDGEYPTFGELFVAAKNDASSNTKCWTFFGDPAIRLAYPKNKVVITAINGHNPDEVCDTLKALEKVTITGEVRDSDDVLMDEFFGIVSLKIYDKESSVTTIGDECEPITFMVRNSVVFNGKANVDGGRFSISFTLPKDIAANYGGGLMNLYATDYETDAGGSFKDFVIGGYSEGVQPETDYPEAKIFMDDAMFVNGSVTNENPVFYALVKDKDGINTSEAFIGHNIKITLEGATNKSYNINDFYEAPLSSDDYGTIKYPLNNLNAGEHTLTFKVWDIYNNSTTETLTFNVVKSSTLYIDNISCYPNPIRDHASFIYDFNQKDSNTEVVIRIYDIMGRLVRTIEESRYGESGRSNPIQWDGTGDGGCLLQDGLYVYYITITNDKGEQASGYSKFVLTH